MILSVNIDHVATIRQARLGREPDPIVAANLAMLAGADGITVHLREDRRHIQDRDLRLLKEIINIPLNLEMAATDEMIEIAIKTNPESVTIVPEKRQELTTEGGLNVHDNKDHLKSTIGKLQNASIPVSLFINPKEDDIKEAKATGADMVEIHTGTYADAETEPERTVELKKIKDAVKTAKSLNLKVNAGHGLNYVNVLQITEIKHLSGLYIGHSIVSRAVFVGMEKAVKDMKELIYRAQM